MNNKEQFDKETRDIESDQSQTSRIIARQLSNSDSSSLTINIPPVVKRTPVFDAFSSQKSQDTNKNKMDSESSGFSNWWYDPEPEDNQTFYPALRLHGKFSSSNPVVNEERKVERPTQQRQATKDSGFLGSVESVESKEETQNLPCGDQKQISRKTSSPPVLVSEQRGRKPQMQQRPEPLYEEKMNEFGSSEMAEKKGDASFFGRVFGFGGRRSEASAAQSDAGFTDEERKKSSIADMLLQRGVFAKGFEVTPDEINVLFNQK